MAKVIILPSDRSMLSSAVFSGKGVQVSTLDTSAMQSTRSLVAAVRSELENTTVGEMVILLNSLLPVSDKRASDLVQALAESHSIVRYVSLESPSNTVEISEVSYDEIGSMLLADGVMPSMTLSVQRELALELMPQEATSANELIATMLLSAMLNNHAVQAMHLSSPMVVSDQSLEISGESRSRMLKIGLASANIEDLFPNHDWRRHELESSATVHHTLAAAFVRYGDLEAALDCLNQSSCSQESPRALALRGIIAMRKGESLAAVAHLVSSLQRYEEQYEAGSSREDSIINKSLIAGLEQLNRKANADAAQHFLSAVRKFDTFFASL